MAKEYWSPENLTKAARLLEQAAANIRTSHPHSERYPDPLLLPAAKFLICEAAKCIEAAEPTTKERT